MEEHEKEKPKEQDICAYILSVAEEATQEKKQNECTSKAIEDEHCSHEAKIIPPVHRMTLMQIQDDSMDCK